jgi:methyl-accepting chemotaxis protein
MFRSLSAKLSASFAVVVLLLVAVAAGSYMALRQGAAINGRITEATMPTLLAADEVESAHLTAAVLVRDIVSHGDLTVQQQSREALKAQRERLRAGIDVLARLGTAKSSTIASLAEQQRDADAILDNALALVDRAQYDEAQLAVYEELRPLQAVVAERLRDLKSSLAEDTRQASAEAASGLARSLALMAAGTLLAILAAVVGAVWITRRISRSILAAVAATERVAEGDLTVETRASPDSETGRLVAALERMRHQLSTAVDSVRRAAEGVNVASQQIASGNSELSARTEEQSAALEEASSAMQQLTSTVQVNADDATQANRLAQDASAVAQRGGDAMRRVVDTMGGIEQSSRRIGDIVGVIDSIAFQTNILALNAAVEAARAGEQGRGFAVVASEVRTLAHRSAAAAKEIKDLIGASAREVQVGNTLVSETGRTIEDIVASVREVTAIMEKIATASAEQLAGIRGVGVTVTQMEQITQQNAALVGESASAAEHMAQQARTLVATVARFRTGEHELPVRSPTPEAAPALQPRQSTSLRAAHSARAPAALAAADEDWKEF